MLTWFAGMVKAELVNRQCECDKRLGQALRIFAVLLAAVVGGFTAASAPAVTTPTTRRPIPTALLRCCRRRRPPQRSCEVRRRGLKPVRG
jgi:hypothetical protein